MQTRCTILGCVGEAAKNCSSVDDLRSSADDMTQKFIMPAMQSAVGSLKVAALKATSEVAKALQNKNGNSLTVDTEPVLVHHNDLIHEAIECMKAKHWLLNDKNIALITTLELVRLPPFVSQLTRY